MCSFGIFLLLLLSLSNNYPLYNLYSGPYQLSDPLQGLDFSSDKQIVIMPKQSQLIIAIQLMPYFQMIIIEFFSSNNQIISKIEQFSRDFFSSSQLVDAFWIDNQYLLVVGDEWKIFYRPQFNNQQISYQLVPNDYANFAVIVGKKQNGENQFTTIIKSNEQWLLRKQALTFNSSVLTQTIPLCQITKNEFFVKLIKLKSFQCVLLKRSNFFITYDYRFACYHLDSSQVYMLTFTQKFDIKNVAFDQATDTVYTVGEINYRRQLVRRELLLVDNNLQASRQQIVQNLKPIQDIRINNNQVIALILEEPVQCQGYFAIISINNPDNPFVNQFFQPNLTYCYKDLNFFAREKDIFVVSPLRQTYDWFYLSQINKQLNYVFIIGTCAIFLLLILLITFKSATNYPIYCQILKIEKRLKITFFQITLTLIALPASMLLQVLSTDTTKSTSFAPSSTRSVPLESYTLKIFSLLFLFVSLISTVFQTYAQHRSKSRYLNMLIKHGLSLEGYFFIKQHFLIVKSLLYSILSTYFLVFLDLNYSSEQFQLFPTSGQIMAMIVAYFACFFTAYNTSLLLVYYFVHYWMSICVSMSMTFLIAFSNGEFYLNNAVSIQQLLLIFISPQSLFSAITQHIFKTQIRFNQEHSTYLLFGAILAQFLCIFVLYKVYLTSHYGKTRIQQLFSNKQQQSPDMLINYSEEGTSDKSMEKQLICNRASNSPLLDVFIPCKLSNNQGFEKISLLKNIRFTANKGEVVTFLGCANLEKAMLFKILINDEKSDSYIEKDLVGSVSYKQPVTISYCFQDQHCFQELTVHQHVELFSILKNTKMSKEDRKSKIKFMLNQFNIPDEFRIMKPRELTGGYLKKMNLACTFIGDPDVVIVDEPSLGLDNRFRGLLYKKLRERKQSKLIMIGTSDGSEAENISDKIWTLQKSKIVDQNSGKQIKFITRINLHFFQAKDLYETETMLSTIFKDLQVRTIENQRENKERYQIMAQIYQTQDNAFFQCTNKLIVSLNQKFGLTGNRCLVDLSIVEHPYDESVFLWMKQKKRKSIQLQQLQYFMNNNALDVSSDQELQEVNSGDRIMTKSLKMLSKISKVEKQKYLLYSQFRAILYRRYRLWQNNKLYHQSLVASVYSWLQYLLWYKINRQTQYYDFVNMLVIYCFLHTSIFSLKENSSLSNKKEKTYLIGGNPLVVTLANNLFNFLNIFISFVSNLLLQILVINIIVLGDLDHNLFQKLLSGVFYILNYTVYVLLLSKIIKRMDILFAIILLTQLSLMGVNFNSFILSYNTYHFNIFQAIKYIHFPLATIYLHQSLVTGQEKQHYIICLLASAFIISLVHLLIQLFLQKQIAQSKSLTHNKNIHNEPIDAERVFIENIEDRSKVPLICQNIIHKYSKEVVVKNFSCHINEGEIFGLLGHNGCGKTTIFNIVAGAVSQSSGIVEQFGKEKRKIDYLEKLNRGYCPQSGSLEQQLTVEQNIRFVGMIKGLTSNYITKFMLLFLKYFRLKGIEQVKAKYLSQAEKKKISFIIAFLGFPKLLYFDEITSGVEQESRKRMLELMRAYCDEYNASIFFSTHNIHQAEGYCDRVSIMKDGVMKNAGEPMKLRVSKYHEFYLLQLCMSKSDQALILQKKKGKVKQYIYSLIFIRIEFEGNFRLIYSLDMMKVNILSVWNRIFFEFYKKGIIEKFTLKRHGLEEVVKQSLLQQQQRGDMWKTQSEIAQS